MENKTNEQLQKQLDESKKLQEDTDNKLKEANKKLESNAKEDVRKEEVITKKDKSLEFLNEKIDKLSDVVQTSDIHKNVKGEISAEDIEWISKQRSIGTSWENINLIRDNKSKTTSPNYDPSKIIKEDVIVKTDASEKQEAKKEVSFRSNAFTSKMVK